MHSARLGDSIARLKDRVETVYLDPCGEILTQVLIHYMVNPSGEYSLLGSDSLFGSEHFHLFFQVCIAGTITLTAIFSIFPNDFRTWESP